MPSRWYAARRWITSPRAVSSIRTTNLGALTATTSQTECRSEIDNHADTCVVGTKTALLIHDYDRPVKVHGYDDGVREIEACRTVRAVIAYDHPESGDTYMLVLHQAILIPQMENNLLCPLQMRDNDVRVNDEPKFMALTPTDNHHAIVINGSDQDQQQVNIPLSIRGVISYFPLRKPTREEYEGSDPDLRIKMTAEEPEWDPRTTWFESWEESMTDLAGKLIDRPVK